jgi:AcrR family transcriptional regulator
MPLPRFQKLDPARRRSLLDAAAGEFAAHGYGGASLNRAIERAGLSKGVFYYYFDDKADLFATVLERAWEAILPDETVDLESLDAASFWPTTERLCGEILERSQDHPWLAGIGKLFYHPPPTDGLEDLVDEHFQRAQGWLGRFLARGQQLGVVRDDLPGDLLLAMLFAASEAADHWMVEHWDDVEPETLDVLGRRLFATLRRIAEPAQ